MKISIKNFKSIDSVIDYELKPLTILSGTNSSGKSSFIQLLLLLKQTLDIESTKFPLFIDGPLFSARKHLDLIRKKDKENSLEIAFKIKKEEFEELSAVVEKSPFDSFNDYTCELRLKYAFDKDSVYVNEFEIVYVHPEKSNFIKFTQTKGRRHVIDVSTNNEYFVTGIYDTIPPVYTDIVYSSIFPVSVEITRSARVENTRTGKLYTTKTKVTDYPKLGSIRSYFKHFFNEVYYVGPLRSEPKDSYSDIFLADDENSVGVKGDRVAQILEEKKSYPVEVLLPKFTDDGITWSQKKLTLLEAVNFWICEVFQFGKRLYAKKSADNYSVILDNHFGVGATIKHVGFGVSQVLPVIVQGLLIKPGGTLILEQPEIHLHPMVQSYLFDFLNSLMAHGKRVIIETHSDHFITRMRRRIAEDLTSSLKDKINLTFIEQEGDGLMFRSMDLDDYGAFRYFPDRFIERPDIELKALLKAQMKKRNAQKK